MSDINELNENNLLILMRKKLIQLLDQDRINEFDVLLWSYMHALDHKYTEIFSEENKDKG